MRPLPEVAEYHELLDHGVFVVGKVDLRETADAAIAALEREVAKLEAAVDAIIEADDRGVFMDSTVASFLLTYDAEHGGDHV